MISKYEYTKTLIKKLYRTHHIQTVARYVGALKMGNRIWRVFYRNVFLAYFNENELRT